MCIRDSVGGVRDRDDVIGDLDVAGVVAVYQNAVVVDGPVGIYHSAGQEVGVDALAPAVVDVVASEGHVGRGLPRRLLPGVYRRRPATRAQGTVEVVHAGVVDLIVFDSDVTAGDVDTFEVDVVNAVAGQGDVVSPVDGQASGVGTVADFESPDRDVMAADIHHVVPVEFGAGAVQHRRFARIGGVGDRGISRPADREGQFGGRVDPTPHVDGGSRPHCLLCLCQSPVRSGGRAIAG